MKNIVILGGSFAGVRTAHLILKQAAKVGPFKVTLVSPNDQFYWTLASPRALIPGQYTDDMLFRSIPDGFAHYPAGRFEYIMGSAQSLDVEAKEVEISTATGSTTVPYDYLILCTGSSTKGDIPVSSIGSTEATKSALHNLQEQVKRAKIVVVAGAGATGVEIAGEVAYEYGRDKEVILISKGHTVLGGRPANFSKNVTTQLRNLNVDIKLQTEVNGLAMLSDGRQELTLSSGAKIVADLYIPTFGIRPNSSYVPVKYLNHNGFVQVDAFLKVKGSEAIWAIGDISDLEPPQKLYCDNQSSHLAKNMILILSGKKPLPYKAATTYMMGLQIGKQAGTGHYGNMKIPSCLIKRIRRNLFLEEFEGFIDGSAL